MKIRNFTLIILIVLLIVAGCSKQLDQLIIGKWRDEKDSTKFFEFFPDKTLIWGTGRGTLSAKWSIVSDSRIKIEMTTHGITRTMFLEQIHFSDETMTSILQIQDEKGNNAKADVKLIHITE